MCFDPTAIPPAIPEGVTSGISDVESYDLILGEGDGSFRAFVSRAQSAVETAVVVLPDVRGLFEYYRQLTVRFASVGHHAVAIDYFGRTAGTGERSEDFDFMSHIGRTTPEQVQADVAAAVDHLRSTLGARRVVTVGFCFGGSQSYLGTANPQLALDGAVAFYGGLDGTRLGVFPSPEDRGAGMSGPILALFGGADPSITPEMIDRFDAALSRHGVEHEFVTYPGTPHSFFDRRHGEFVNECDDAWRRVLDFLATAR
ncbi:dienelactone hydrolase family protein [Rhodococcus sp. 2H158]